MRWKVVLVLIFFVVVSTQAGEEEFFSASSEKCTVRFADIPSSYGDLRKIATFDSATHESIQKLIPSDEGLFLIRVNSLDAGPVYSSYWATEQEARDHPLPSDFSSLSGRRVTEQSDPEALQGDIQPGYYRVVLRYYPPEIPRSASKRIRWRKKAKRVLLCEAITPAMKLDEAIMLVRME